MASWDVIGQQFILTIHHFFKTKTLPNQLKHSLIALVPKVKHSNKLFDYRPISLCNMMYKFIAKVLANRIKGILPDIIHPTQSTFIKEKYFRKYCFSP